MPQLCQGTVWSDRPRWKGRLWLSTAVPGHFQVSEQEVWFNQNFSAWLERGYDELFKAELFLSNIKSKAVILYNVFSSWILLFSFIQKSLTWKWCLFISDSYYVCVCACVRLNLRRKGSSVASEKSIAREPVQLLRYFLWCLGSQGPLLGLGSQNSLGYASKTDISKISVIYINKGWFVGHAMRLPWIECLCPLHLKSICEALTPNVMVFGGN